jgi:hypothetical protein
MTPPARSTFVTVIGWIFAVISGFGLLISVMQNIMLHTVFPVEQMTADIPADMPSMARFAFEHFELLFLIPLLVSAVMLSSAVGLIKRLEWARKLMVALMALAALWSRCSIGFQFVWMAQFPTPPGEAAEVFAAMETFMLAFMLIWGLGFAALFGWIAKRLMSWDIKQEFRPFEQS